MRFQHEIKWQLDTLIGIYKQNSKVCNVKRQAQMDRFVFYTEYLFKIGLCLYCSSAMSYFVYPPLIYYSQKEIVMITPMRLPFIDEHSQAGYVTFSVFHFLLISSALLGSSCSDLLWGMTIVNVPMLANILKDEVERLDELVAKSKVNVAHQRYYFRNILLLHREYTA